MSKKNFKKDKKGKEEEWSWEETSEVREALNRLHRDIGDNIRDKKDEL